MPEKRTFEMYSTGAGVFKLKPRLPRSGEQPGDVWRQIDWPTASSRTGQTAQNGFVVSREVILRIIAILKDI